MNPRSLQNGAGPSPCKHASEKNVLQEIREELEQGRLPALGGRKSPPSLLA